MQLALQHNPHTQRPTAAAFIRGATPGIWLHAINSWNIPIHQLNCFIVPAHMNTVEAAGLLVIFPSGNIPAPELLSHPYSAIADKLYIPADASLTPAISLQELQSLLIWEVQLYHPTIGFVGFEAADRLALTELLAWTPPKNTDWTYAHSGLPAVQPLRQIGVTQPTMEQVFSSLRESVSNRPLAEIIPERERNPSFLSRLLNILLLPLLLLIRWLSILLDKLAKWYHQWQSRRQREQQPLQPPKSSKPGKPAKSRPRWLQKAQRWIEMRMEELEARRESELQRLMKLFETNSDEALQYAIPLDSPYMGRGQAPPSARLGRQSTNFDLGRLGGGGAVDVWNVGDYYANLRAKYQQAAEKELQAGNYKKAAYIYAHLMGNYQAAAKALEEGQHYREAATLYKEHIKNIPAAAACLERGGLLLEAIELYDELKEHEKAGDLYMRLEQGEQAEVRYERCIEQSSKHNNYLAAARIMDQKLVQPERAKTTLLKGWQGNFMPEACLTNYFELLAKDKATGPLDHHIRRVFEEETFPASYHSFLQVLLAVNKQHAAPEVNAAATQVAWQVVGRQLSAGDTTSMALLKDFIPEDKLLPGDIKRFNIRKQPMPAPVAPVTNFQLARDVRWLGATNFGPQLLIVGVTKAGIHLVRANDKGNWEYHLWSLPVDSLPNFSFAADFPLTDHVYLYSAEHTRHGFLQDNKVLMMQDKVLPATHDFLQEIHIKCPNWLPKGLLGFAVSHKGQVFTLHTENGSHVIFSCYLPSGSLVTARDCKVSGEPVRFLQPNAKVQEMIHRDHYFYMAYGEYALRVNTDGDMQAINLQSPVMMLSASTVHTATRIIVATEKGCVLLLPNRQQMNLQPIYFAQVSHVRTVCYVPDGLVVVGCLREAIVYNLKEVQGGADAPLAIIRTESTIVSIRTISKRNHCAIIEESGRVSIHNLLAQ